MRRRSRSVWRSVAGALTLAIAIYGALPAGTPRGAAQPAPVPAAPEGQRAEAGRGAIARLSWLSGCWQRRNGARIVDEQWMTPRGGTMLGMSRTVRGDTLVEFEQLRIFERDGRLVFAAAPSGQAPSEFVSILVDGAAVTFENRTHDFPQRVLYRRVGADSLHARIEGTIRGQARAVDFPYVRAACP